ncbi:hypothetical protein HDU76_013604 [Blyttiomyces sp. JEL0837]|nr:hypothetical protein HDU76_013604 [Blyttiomyces sp. JEL0837]
MPNSATPSMDEAAVRQWLATHKDQAVNIFKDLGIAANDQSITTSNDDSQPPPSPIMKLLSPNLSRRKSLGQNSNAGSTTPSGLTQHSTPLSTTPNSPFLHHHQHGHSHSHKNETFINPARQLSSEILFELARNIYSSLNVSTVVSRVLTIAVTVVNAERCSVFLLDDEAQELYATAWDVAPTEDVMRDLEGGGAPNESTGVSTDNVGGVGGGSGGGINPTVVSGNGNDGTVVTGGVVDPNSATSKLSQFVSVRRSQSLKNSPKSGRPASAGSVKRPPVVDSQGSLPGAIIDIAVDDSNASGSGNGGNGGNGNAAAGAATGNNLLTPEHQQQQQQQQPKSPIDSAEVIDDDEHERFRDFVLSQGGLEDPTHSRNSQTGTPNPEHARKHRGSLQLSFMDLENPNNVASEAGVTSKAKPLGGGSGSRNPGTNSLHGSHHHCAYEADSHGKTPSLRIKVGVGVAGYVAQTGKGLNVADAYKDPRFNKEMDIQTGFRTRNILCMPIFGGPSSEKNPKGKILGVASLVNKVPVGVVPGATGSEDNGGADQQHLKFTDEDVSLFRDFLVIVGVALYNSMLYETAQSKERQALLESRKSKILLEVARSLYLEENSSDLCRAIIVHARDLTNSDRASIFLVDSNTEQLYSTVFDNQGSAAGSAQRFSFPMNKGIAGFVATTGQAVNLKNAYEDPRFNQEMDKKTGYHTQSVLCSPIVGPTREIVGVSYLINKKNEFGEVEAFTKEDEEIFAAFSTFCGLALHKTLMLEKLRAQQQKLEITMDIMSYHATAHEDDISKFMSEFKAVEIEAHPLQTPLSPSQGPPQRTGFLAKSPFHFGRKKIHAPADAHGGNALAVVPHPTTGPTLVLPSMDAIRDATFDPHNYTPNDDRLALIVCLMFKDLGYCHHLEISEEKLAAYVLTVRKNYRLNAYHNFTHAACVVHAIYMLITKGVFASYGFDEVDGFAMFLAALNHDIDHRGTNNQFQKTASTALASFYSTSIMERHHFNHAMTILSSLGHDLLANIPAEHYKRCLQVIEYCILATDLALYFKNRKATMEMGREHRYNPVDSENRNLLMGIVMTCSDLSAMFKNWEDAQRTADAVYQEFFSQGDEEIKLGLTYSSELVNRANEPQIPRMQVDFYTNIVTPAFETLEAVMGEQVQFLMNRVRENEQKWKSLRDSGTPYKISTKH